MNNATLPVFLLLLFLRFASFKVDFLGSAMVSQLHTHTAVQHLDTGRKVHARQSSKGFHRWVFIPCLLAIENICIILDWEFLCISRRIYPIIVFLPLKHRKQVDRRALIVRSKQFYVRAAMAILKQSSYSLCITRISAYLC